MGIAAPTAPELEAQLFTPDLAPCANGTGLAAGGETAAVRGAHDPPLFLLGCAYLI
jgi:hypothetical protein